MKKFNVVINVTGQVELLIKAKTEKEAESIAQKIMDNAVIDNKIYNGKQILEAIDALTLELDEIIKE